MRLQSIHLNLFCWFFFFFTILYDQVPFDHFLHPINFFIKNPHWNLDSCWPVQCIKHSSLHVEVNHLTEWSIVVWVNVTNIQWPHSTLYFTKADMGKNKLSFPMTHLHGNFKLRYVLNITTRCQQIHVTVWAKLTDLIESVMFLIDIVFYFFIRRLFNQALVQ